MTDSSPDEFREPALFDVPASVRALYARLDENGDFYMPGLDEYRYVPGAVDGSWYGMAATHIGSIPVDARFARVSGRAKDLRRLADLRDLDVLAIQDATDAALSIAGEMRGLRRLHLDGIKAQSLDGLRGHAGLEYVMCRGAARLRNAEALATLPNLRTLWIDVSGLKSLDHLAGLTQIRNLLFTGGLTSLPTLAPLSGLRDLAYLTVGHVRVKNRSLRPLHALTELRGIVLPEAFPLEELAALAAALPDTRGLQRSAFYTTTISRQIASCQRCGSRDVVLTIGVPSRALCRACDDRAIRKHALRWELALADAASRAGTAAGASSESTAAGPARGIDPIPEPITDDPAARIPESRRGPSPPPFAEPEEPWKAARPARPWADRFVSIYKTPGGVGGVHLLNAGELFEGGVCEACGMARGPRTEAPLRYRHSSGQEAHYDGWLASPRPGAVTIYLYSDRFLSLLTDVERDIFHFRPAVNTAYGKKDAFELVGSAVHLPLATLRGGSPDTFTCGACGFVPPPRYEHATTRPPWLNPDGDTNVWRGQPSLYVSSANVPHPPPSCFTVGDWRERVSIAVPAERWAAMAALKGKARLRAITAWDLAIVPPDVVEP